MHHSILTWMKRKNIETITCEICNTTKNIQELVNLPDSQDFCKHHLRPNHYHKGESNQSRKILCNDCHEALHQLCTNQFLEKNDFDAIREVVLKKKNIIEQRRIQKEIIRAGLNPN